MDRAKMDRARGILYFATGAKYYREAARSALSAKKRMPDIPIVCASDIIRPGAPFDAHLKVASKEYPLLLKTRVMARSPFAKTLFLDSDTLVTGKLYEVFDLLDEFDFAAAIAPVRLSSNRDKRQERFLGGASKAFPEFNTGVVAYKASPKMSALFERWTALYRHQLQGAIKPWTWDQLALREVLYRSDLRLATLPPEYNYRLPFPNVACGRVKVFHGRHKDLVKLAQEINSRRLYKMTAPKAFEKIAKFF